MKALLQDPIFFYGVAYVGFLVVAWFLVRKPSLAWVDGEIGKIRDELEQARRLRVEAEAALAEAKAKKTATIAQAQSILAHAKEEAARLQSEAAANLTFVLARHEQHALERISYMEKEAVTQIRAATVDIAMELVRKTLVDRMDESVTAKLADQAIADMPKLTPAKAKVA
jgi:F-type H+-transporting ATPase subunit b